VEERFVALALPFFTVLIAVEVLLCRRLKDERRYRFPDSITDLSCGLGTQVLEPFLRTAGLAGYVLLYDHVRLATVPTTSLAGWVALVVLVDFFYYVFHRASHRINLFWALHVVHHQSEEYNLVVALRQSWFELLFSGVFYLPLAVAGFSPVAFVAVSTSNTLYQFWIHTRLVGRLPRWLESWLNTPSHHRVHHGVNPKYIDKNYGGMFIVWDRWLGTFQEEEEEPVYGTVKPLASFNPLWANVHYWVEMATLARSASRLADKLRVVFAPPEWRPRELSNGLGYVTIPEASRATQRKYDVPTSRGLVAYVSLQFAIALGASTLAMTFGSLVPAGVATATLALILVEVVAWGALFEAKPWGTTLAVLRLLATAAVLAWFSRGAAMGMALTIGGGVAVAAMAVWVVRLGRGRQPAGSEAVAAPM
jgi:sterol desaturase/sphingolipid hydroxylase (fatty acid hydroxylase superfamily)